MRGRLGEDRRAAYGISNEDLFDPRTNVRIAYDIFVQAGHSFTPWGAFTSGGYKKFGRYEKAQDAVALDLARQAEVVMTLQYDPPSGYTTTIPSGVQALRYGIAEWFGLTRTEVVRDLSRCQQKSSEHCVCRAVDAFTFDGDAIFDFCVWAAPRLGTQSVIWQHREWGFGRWYERYRSKEDHFDHVHFGVNKWGAANVTRAMVDEALKEYFEEDDMFTDEDRAKLEAVWKDHVDKVGTGSTATYKGVLEDVNGGLGTVLRDIVERLERIEASQGVST